MKKFLHIFVLLAGNLIYAESWPDCSGGEHQVPYTENPYFLIERNNKYGFIDKTGKEIIEPGFDWFGGFVEGLVVVGIKKGPPPSARWEAISKNMDNPKITGLYGFIGKTGRVVVEPRFNNMMPFSGGMARFLEQGKWGLINADGKIIANAQYDEIGDFTEKGFAQIKSSGKKGIIGRDGKIMILTEFDSVYPEDFDGDSLIRFGQNYKTGYMDRSGKIVVEPNFEAADAFSEGLAGASLEFEKPYGFIDSKGGWIIPPQFEEVRQFFKGFAPAKSKGLWGLVDSKGRWKITPQFEAITHSSGDNFYRISTKDSWGLMDSKGKIIQEPHYENIGKFKNGFAAIKAGEQWGYLDSQGREAIRPQYEFADDFKADGFAAVKIKGKWGRIDKTGEIAIEPLYEDIGRFCYGLSNVSLNGKWGFIDRKGKMVIEPIYDHSYGFSEGGLAKVTEKGKDIYIDTQGRQVWP